MHPISGRDGRVELRQLRIFVAVCDEGGFTAAGRRVGVVQSAVSSTVRALERDLGHELFARTSRRVDLTDAGRALLPEARRALAAADAARDAVDAVRGGLRGTVRIGTMHPRVLRPLRLPQLLARFRAEHPDVEIRLLHGPTSAEKLQLVRDGRLDLALVGAGGPPPAGVRYLPLKREVMQLACHRDHPLATRAEVGLALLAGETFVDGPPDSASRVTNDAAFAAAGVSRSIAFEINDTSGMIDMVEAGLAVAILPPSIAEGLDAVRCVPLTRAAPVLEVSLAVPVNRRAGAAADDLAARILSETTGRRRPL